MQTSPYQNESIKKPNTIQALGYIIAIGYKSAQSTLPHYNNHTILYSVGYYGSGF